MRLAMVMLASASVVLSGSVTLAASATESTYRGLVVAPALRAMLGVDLTAIPTIGVETALTIASEVGPDVSRSRAPRTSVPG